MMPRFRAYGYETNNHTKEKYKKMHYDVSVTVEYRSKEVYVIKDFEFWGVEEYSGTLIEEAVITQSTGAYDFYDKEIFEGDIIENCHGEKFVVFYQEDELAWGLIDEKADTMQVAKYELEEEVYQYKVIGNIYENPELIGGESDDY